mmetsp:Transcript_1708/g.4970  ORF Transcript_1708/g.4970 Transcript_1708/m.4970 type:complete len:201 (+) Transcript_1708:1158-1760(+)
MQGSGRASWRSWRRLWRRTWRRRPPGGVTASCCMPNPGLTVSPTVSPTATPVVSPPAIPAALPMLGKQRTPACRCWLTTLQQVTPVPMQPTEGAPPAEEASVSRLVHPRTRGQKGPEGNRAARGSAHHRRGRVPSWTKSRNPIYRATPRRPSNSGSTAVGVRPCMTCQIRRSSSPGWRGDAEVCRRARRTHSCRPGRRRD